MRALSDDRPVHSPFKSEMQVQSPARYAPPMKPRVIIISIDGFAAFYWRDPAVRAPVLRGLAERGVLAAGMEMISKTTVVALMKFVPR